MLCERGRWCLNGDAFIVQLVYSCSLAWALAPVTGVVAGADCLGGVLHIISVSSQCLTGKCQPLPSLCVGVFPTVSLLPLYLYI